MAKVAELRAVYGLLTANGGTVLLSGLKGIGETAEIVNNLNNSTNPDYCKQKGIYLPLIPECQPGKYFYSE